MDGIPEELPWGLGTGFAGLSSLGSLALGKSLRSLLSLGSLGVLVVVVVAVLVVVFVDGAADGRNNTKGIIIIIITQSSNDYECTFIAYNLHHKMPN